MIHAVQANLALSLYRFQDTDHRHIRAPAAMCKNPMVQHQYLPELPMQASMTAQAMRDAISRLEL
jgi:hypothetical protein